ncbi:uncharacterized protein LOC141926764 [Strix aluco]|uniref:uncharacterized protein LOC141926764 n=1 Tax=Strix aluco TaxID=111821 RepID=UPI003DA48ACB
MGGGGAGFRLSSLWGSWRLTVLSFQAAAPEEERERGQHATRLCSEPGSLPGWPPVLAGDLPACPPRTRGECHEPWSPLSPGAARPPCNQGWAGCLRWAASRGCPVSSGLASDLQARALCSAGSGLSPLCKQGRSFLGRRFCVPSSHLSRVPDSEPSSSAGRDCMRGNPGASIGSWRRRRKRRPSRAEGPAKVRASGGMSGSGLPKKQEKAVFKHPCPFGDVFCASQAGTWFLAVPQSFRNCSKST